MLRHTAALHLRRSLDHLSRVATTLAEAPAGSAAGSQLLRDYIHDQLYHPQDGYFTKFLAPVACLKQPFDFGSLLGKTEYLRKVKQAYKELQVAWLTPSEIFSPFYGQAVATYMLQQHRAAVSARPLRVYELGAGTGTLARDILDHVKTVAPSVYRSCSYTSCEISPALAEVQQRRVADAAGHSRRFTVEVRDAAAPAGWGEPRDEHCFLLAMEVLDNCPHDRVVRSADGAWLQEEVRVVEGRPELMHLPLGDAWIRKSLQAALEVDSELRPPSLWQRLLDAAIGEGGGHSRPYSQESSIWLPTKAAMLLQTLLAARPHHDLIVADFHALPDVAIAGRSAPLVATTVDGRTEDLQSYLIEKGSADIFFPTDFLLLLRLYQASAPAGSAVDVRGTFLSARTMMERFADIGATTTRSGYNPLLEDYTNTSFLLGKSRPRKI